MKIERWLIHTQNEKETAMLYLAEAEICLRTAGQFRGITKNPVLGHAAFATLHAVLRVFHELDPDTFWNNLRLSTFFFSFYNGELEPSNNQMRFAEAMDKLKNYGVHNVTLFRSKSSVDAALKEVPDLELGPYVLCLEEWVAEMYRVAPMIEKKATA